MAPMKMPAVLVASVFAALAFAAPTPTELEAITKVEARQAATGISNSDELSSALSQFTDAFYDLASAIDIGESILTEIAPSTTPTSIAQVTAELQSINNEWPGDLFAVGYEILLNGLAGGDFQDIADSFTTESSTDNSNTDEPANSIYPQAGSDDAPYSLSEDELRSAIYIPPGFTYGSLPAVLFIPGTSSYAGTSFGANYGNLFAQNGIADPVYVNIPGAALGDIQVNAEYVAYAINYISGISNGASVSDQPKPSSPMCTD